MLGFEDVLLIDFIVSRKSCRSLCNRQDVQSYCTSPEWPNVDLGGGLVSFGVPLGRV